VCLAGWWLVAGAWAGEPYVYEAGHPSLREWLLPAAAPSPDDNRHSEARAQLGKQLFFDPRLSGTGQVTCSSCHIPERGWADGSPTATRFHGKKLQLASPSLVNVGFNSIHMWDGRMPTLEKQAFAGQDKAADINAGSAVEPEAVIARLNGINGYLEAFARAYPGEGLTRQTVAKAVAAFERTIVSNDSPFDRWVRGEAKAMTEAQIRGFRVFVEKGRCAGCHSPPNFTDNGFHNIGLASFGEEGRHPGRFTQRKVKAMEGAFKTPTLRDVGLTAPYFHDGSAATLAQVVEHYVSGGVVKTNLSPTLPASLALSAQERAELVAFLGALDSPQPVFVYPVLPQR
jgi:cytochrome c peroxidase